MTEIPEPLRETQIATQRQDLLTAVAAGLNAPRNNANKWSPLYQWFQETFGLDGGTSAGVIGKVITERKQIGNRVDEMAKYDPKYLIITVLGDVEPEAVLRIIRERRFPSLKCILFLRELTPDEFVIFDD